ncbi:hypothetical protein [Streptomyces cyaneofuscatus]|uniref:hypothetical protein n=1 Tax=Streptomyces cyaneofuscatus TaxID=66883 RepID=UPI00339F74FB
MPVSEASGDLGGMARQEPGSGAAPATHTVIVTSAGTPFLDGLRVRVPKGGNAPEAVLAALHARARAAGQPVRGQVEDRQEGYVALFEVAPDGSSRLLGAETFHRPGTPRNLPHSVEGPGAPAAEPAVSEEVSSPNVSEEHAIGPASHSVAGVFPLPTADPVPSSDDEPEPAPEPGPVGVPKPLAASVAQVNVALSSGDPSTAAELATRLSAEADRLYGSRHIHALEARSMEAYARFLVGERVSALTLSLSLAEARLDRGENAAAWQEWIRAALAWRSMTDGATRNRRAAELADVLDRFSPADGPPVATLPAAFAAELRRALDGLPSHPSDD